LEITGKVSWNDICPDAASLGQAKVSLDDGIFTSSVTYNGNFTIPDVADGTYILSLISHDYFFDQLRLDVTNSTLEVLVRPYITGTPLNPPSPVLLPYPVVLIPREKSVYFVPLETFNLVTMMSNPMMLLMVLGGGMMLAMPYLMKTLEPDAVEEQFKEQQGRIKGELHQELKTGLTPVIATGDEHNNPVASSNKSGGGGPKSRTNRKAKR